MSTPPRSTLLLLLLLSTTLAFEARDSDGTVSAAVSSSGGVEELSGGGKKKRKKKGKGQPATKEPASSLMIVVDDLEDRIQPGDALPRSRDAACSVTTGTLDRSAKVTSRGTCTLRAALEMADGVSGGGSVVLRLRPGRYRLAGRLPEVQGKVHILGAEGKRGQPKKAPPLPSDPAARRKKQLELDTADVFDPHFRPPRPGDEIGQRTAIGTTLDGDEQFQILFGGRGSQLKVENVRLEDGRATDEGGGASDEGVRRSLGGAINALGKLTMVNTAVRGNRAINGGALYTEARVRIERSMAEHNVADRCGGMIYSAGKTAVASSQIQANRCGHYDCKKKTAAQIIGPVDEDGYIEPPPPPPNAVGEDGLGAIAEGPPLTNVRVMTPEEAAAAQEEKTRAKEEKTERRRKRKPSSAAVAELDGLADELEYEEELEEKMEAEEEAEEEARRRREEHEERMRSMRDDAKTPTEEEEPVACDAEKHGGKGGNGHELSCEAGLWRTGRKMPTECVMWRATANCSAEGERTPDADRGCFEFVPHDASGWCECAGGHTTAPTPCEHEAFTCQRECRLLRQRRKRRRQAERGDKGGAVPSPSPPPPAFAIGAYGTASHLLDGFGLICSDGSRTAVAGTPPATGLQAKNFTPGKSGRGAWEFVCPGWAVCRDAEPWCAEWAAKGECRANPDYMRAMCARACSACPEVAADAEGTHALVGMDVRGGRMVDAVRLRCGAVDYDDLSGRDADVRHGGGGGGGGGGDGDGDGDGDGEPGEEGGPALVSEWFGGAGGAECAVLCSSENISDGWRTGGLVQGVVASAGERIDRLELARCTLDLEV